MSQQRRDRPPHQRGAFLENPPPEASVARHGSLSCPPLGHHAQAGVVPARLRRNGVPRGCRWGASAALALSLALLLVLLLVPLPCGAQGDIVEAWFNVGVKTLNPLLDPRPSVVVNGMWPGPTIYAMDGDTIKVHVFNNQSLPITIHWHGIEHRSSQWYDGVPGITQCAIPFNTTFTYIFQIQGQSGTYWWHSHVAQLRNTMHGALIIKPSPNYGEPLNWPITKEYIFLGGDWFAESPQALMDSIGASPFRGYPLPKTLHLNGGSLATEVRSFVVLPQKYYRIRVVNTAMWGSFNLKIENHTFLVHESEGGYTQPLRVGSLDVYPGQSYALILKADQRPDNYWIVLNPIYDVEKGTARGVGVLSYKSPSVTLDLPLRAFPAGPATAAEKKANGPDFQMQLKSASINQYLPSNPVTKLIVLELNQNTNLSSGQIWYSMNNVSLVGSSMPFLQADYQGQGSSVYRTNLTPDLPPPGLAQQKDGATKFGPGVISIPYGAWVQVVFQNHMPPGGMHPWHLHGFNFWVVAQGNGRFNARRWRRYKYNLVNPTWRNTVAMYDSQWVAVRFHATNPGQWILHCHLEQHADQGLATVFKVNRPKKNSPTRPPPLKAPPQDYPKCM